jgi:uncharacterized membrane protein YraQ (UPF0718 family)
VKQRIKLIIIIGFLIFGIFVGIVTQEYVKYILSSLVVGVSLSMILDEEMKKSDK